MVMDSVNQIFKMEFVDQCENIYESQILRQKPKYIRKQKRQLMVQMQTLKNVHIFTSNYLFPSMCRK